MGITRANTKASATGVDELLQLRYVLSSIGFACLIGWELSVVFGPALSLLGFLPGKDAALLRAVAVCALAASFVFFRLRSEVVLAHRRGVLAVGSVLAVASSVYSIALGGLGATPGVLSIVAWALLGVAQACIMTTWAVLYSSMPTQRTVASVCAGAAGGTALFAIVNTSAVEWVGLLEIAVLAVVSCAIAACVLAWTPKPELPPGGYRESETVTPLSGLSIACHGVVYGFMSMAMCANGLVPALLCGASGVIGVAVAFLWPRLSRRIDVDTGIVQRFSLPLIMAGFLLFPFFEGAGRIVCGCLVNVALAYTSMVAWYSSCVDSVEFQLHPVRTFASRQAPSWIGFFVGSIAGIVCLYVWALSGHDLCFAMAVLSIVVIAAFALYGADESKTRKRLEQLLSGGEGDGAGENVEAVDGNRSEAASGEAAAEAGSGSHPWVGEAFRASCTNVAERYSLTPREAEVFFILARGRNADYIASQLNVSSATVKTHIYHIYRKLGINSQQQLMTIVEGDAGGESACDARSEGAVSPLS